MIKRYILLLVLMVICGKAISQVVPAANRLHDYLPFLNGKRVGIVANHTSMVNNTHLVDTLKNLSVKIGYIFAPEHGFRGTKSAGEHISHDVDLQTGIKIFSLHGATKSPSAESLKNLDVIVFDLQDVGVRFYTYISTLYYIMSAASKSGKEVIVLDRPNPNIHYVDGPILDMKHKSFVGMFPIPVVYGMTIGELARMINSEGWLEDGRRCNLKVIEVGNYTRDSRYVLPVAPSPNLPNERSVLLYPNLCLFEATVVSVGRGTKFPFQQYGHPSITGYDYWFMPKSSEGAKNPPCQDGKCYGVLLDGVSKEDLYAGTFSLKYVVDAYNRMGKPAKFFTPFLEKLIGVGYVREMIEEGKSAEMIAKMWRDDVDKFKKLRTKYLIY